VPGQGIKGAEDPCMSCSGGCNVPSLTEKLSAAHCEVEDQPEEVGEWGWHCAVAMGRTGWQVRRGRDEL